MFFLLFQELQLESKFTNSEGVLNELGIDNDVLGDLKSNLENVKSLDLGEAASGFIPSLGGLLELVKSSSGTHKKEEGLD